MDSMSAQDSNAQATAAGTPVAVSSRPRERQRDRRTAVFEFLGSLAGALQPDAEPGDLRARFEAELQRLIPVRSVALRIGPLDTMPSKAAAERITLDVPGTIARGAVLDAIVDTDRGFDAWDLQLLQAARHVGALVVEIERWRQAQPVRRARGGSLPLIGSGAAITALRERIARIAATDFTVLIEGESGSGKELVARHLHDLSRRRSGPFVAVNCAAIVESLLEAELFGIEDRTATGVRGRRGKFEVADRGTLFLDEVSDLTPSAQAKLLRAIQDLAVERVGGHGSRRIDTRIVAATNRGLLDLVEKGRFRADLYYRLNGVEIRVPPLRDRCEDIPELTAHFLDRYRTVRHLRLSIGALDALMAYEWPGNVRELERVMERAIALARTEEIRLDDLPPRIARGYVEALKPSLVRDESLRTWGSRYARLVLERHQHNKRRACRALGISYHTLRSYLRHQPGAGGTAGTSDAAVGEE